MKSDRSDKKKNVRKASKDLDFSTSRIIHQQQSNQCRSRRRRCATKKGSEGMQLYLKENPTQVFSCEICKLFRNAYFKDPQATVSVTVTMKIVNICL